MYRPPSHSQEKAKRHRGIWGYEQPNIWSDRLQHGEALDLCPRALFLGFQVIWSTAI